MSYQIEVKQERLTPQRMRSLLLLCRKVYIGYSAANSYYEDLAEMLQNIVGIKYDLKWRMLNLSKAFDAFEKDFRHFLRQYLKSDDDDEVSNMMQGTLEQWDSDIVTGILDLLMQVDDDGRPITDNWNYQLKYQYMQVQYNLLQDRAKAMRRELDQQVANNKMLVQANTEMMERLAELGEEIVDEEGNDILKGMQDLCEVWGIERKEKKQKNKPRG